jgi:hypothetical protein
MEYRLEAVTSNNTSPIKLTVIYIVKMEGVLKMLIMNR